MLSAEPGLSARIGRVDADIHDLGHIHAPVAHDAEALLIPIRIGDDVDGDADAERTGELKRLEILAERNALAKFLQAVFVNGLDAEKELGEPELLPELKNFLVTNEHVAARFQI